jgi:hypothetical protein
MTITVTQQKNDYPHQRDYAPPYDLMVDGEKVGQMTVNYPSEPSVWLGKPGVISRLAFRDVPTKELVGLLSANETTIPDKRGIGLMLHAKALHAVQSMTYEDEFTKRSQGFEKQGKTESAKIYADTAAVLRQVKQKLESGDQSYSDVIGQLEELSASLKKGDTAVKNELGEHGYGYLHAELGRTPRNISDRLDDMASSLSAAEKIFTGKHQDLLEQITR